MDGMASHQVLAAPPPTSGGRLLVVDDDPTYATRWTARCATPDTP